MRYNKVIVIVVKQMEYGIFLRTWLVAQNSWSHPGI